MRYPRLSRREVLAGVAAGALGGLAGCSEPSYYDVLRLEVLELQQVGEAFVGRIRLANAPERPEREQPYETRYSDASIVGYAHDREETLRIQVGDVAPDTTVTRDFATNRFPFLLTADAEGVTTEGDYPVERGARVYWYDGHRDGSSTGPGERAGHVWTDRRRRRIADDLPPPLDRFEVHKCRQRERWRATNGTAPDLSIVPGSEGWLEREISPPTVQRQVYFLTYNYSERVREPPDGARHVELEDLPVELRRAVEQDRNPRYMNRSEFFRTLSGFPGPVPANLSESPPCSAPHVTCRDTRGENCREGGGQFTGDLYKTLEYTTSRGNATYAVAATYHERWDPPEAEPLGPCSDRRLESVSVQAYDGENRYRGLERAVRGARVHPALAEYIDRYWERDHSYLPNMDPSMETFERILDGLHGDGSTSPLDCRRPNVVCSFDPAAHCGKGSVDAYYFVDVEEGRTWLRLHYEWAGLPASAEE